MNLAMTNLCQQILTWVMKQGVAVRRRIFGGTHNNHFVQRLTAMRMRNVRSVASGKSMGYSMLKGEEKFRRDAKEANGS